MSRITVFQFERAAPHIRAAHGAAVLGFLAERYSESKTVPYGTYAVLAPQVGLTGERVRQIATEAGYRVGPRGPRRRPR